MTALAPDSIPTNTTTASAPNELSRALNLARAEATLLLRNKTATFIAVITPLSIVLLAGMIPSSAGLPALVLAMLIGTALLFVVYYTLVTSVVARREEHYLKRLYTSTARPLTILVAMALPLLALVIIQVTLGFVGTMVLLDFRPTTSILLVLPAMVLGTMAWWALALASAIFTRTVESAQLTTMPLLLVALLFSGLSLPLGLLPELATTIAQLTPMFPVVDLTILGVSGVRVTGEAVAGADLVRTVLIDGAVLIGWTVAGLAVVRRRFAWEPRR